MWPWLSDEIVVGGLVWHPTGICIGSNAVVRINFNGVLTRPAVRQPNWFIALVCPGAQWFSSMMTRHEAPAGVRAFSASDLHVTVAFLGAVSEAAASKAWWARRRWAVGPVMATLGPVRPFGRRNRYSALSSVIATGAEAVEAGILNCRSAMLEAAGLPACSRPVNAHMTVARPTRRANDDQRMLALEWASKLDCAGIPIALTEIALYTWNDDRRDQLFKIIARDLLSSCKPNVNEDE